ncbi:hypothetical protein ACA910_000195 [Epithemia clementina (nom. ined.)]
MPTLLLLLLVAVVFTFPNSCWGFQKGFSLGIRDSFMVAHSFHDHPAFGPAGGLHGATYTCDVEFFSDDDGIDPETNWVMDIGQASSILSDVLAKYNFKNLDDLFPNGELTTTEFMCRQIHRDLCERLRKDCNGAFSGSVCVKLWESHKAWASYTEVVS